MTILLNDGVETACDGRADASGLWLEPGDAARASGWQLKPEGLCKAELCVPVPAGRESEFVASGRVNLAAFWRYMGKPSASSRDGQVWCFGEDAGARNEAMGSLEAPDFSLPDLNGNYHSLTDFRRKRVLLITWASW